MLTTIYKIKYGFDLERVAFRYALAEGIIQQWEGGSYIFKQDSI